jgi:hypothetical protein
MSKETLANNQPAINRAERRRKNSTGTPGQRRRSEIKEQFTPLLTELLESVPWRVLSWSAYRVMFRLFIELRHHGGFQAKGLPVTYEDFVRYGIRRHSIAPAIREVVALGLVRIVQQGHAGTDYRRPTVFQLICVHSLDCEPTHSWRKFKAAHTGGSTVFGRSDAELEHDAIKHAKQVVREAHEQKNVRRSKNKRPVTDSTPTPVTDSTLKRRHFSVTDSVTTSRVKNDTTIDTLRGGRSGGRLVDGSSVTSGRDNKSTRAKSSVVKLDQTKPRTGMIRDQ